MYLLKKISSFVTGFEKLKLKLNVTLETLEFFFHFKIGDQMYLQNVTGWKT